MKIKFFAMSAIAALPFLASCTKPGADLQANVYQAGQVNQVQNAKVINILTVIPAKVEVSNQQNQQAAEVAGGILGAVGGGLLGGGLTHNANAGIDSAALGGVAGAAAGSMAGSTALVDGVTIGYTEDGQTLSSNSSWRDVPVQARFGHGGFNSAERNARSAECRLPAAAGEQLILNF